MSHKSNFFKCRKSHQCKTLQYRKCIKKGNTKNENIKTKTTGVVHFDHWNLMFYKQTGLKKCTCILPSPFYKHVSITPLPLPHPYYIVEGSDKER